MVVYYFIFGSSGSSLLCVGFLQVQRAGATLQLQCMGFSLEWLLLWQSTGSRTCCSMFSSWQHVGSVAAAHGLQSTGSVVVAHRFSCFAACGIFPNQRLNLSLLHWQADSLPLSHQGNASFFLFLKKICIYFIWLCWDL